MTFDELVSEVCERLNLVSDEAKSRVGRESNARYKRVTTSIGLDTSRLVQVSQAATVASRYITFTGIEKVFAVIDKTDPNRDVVLSQITFDEMHITSIRSQPPRKFAVTGMGPTSVTIYVDCVPANPVFTLYADGLTTVSTLAGNQKPNFPESFHDILVFGAMADEYRKQEKMQLARECEMDFEKRLSDLRYFIAESAYIEQYQGRYASKAFRWSQDAGLMPWDN